ncbi:hypothetical protein NDU88_002742 [Pleurodeles waltl]|uniref:Reverse transcriptase n=1 Tax=Pleurodeles waltl TaxID=8319 RepID=A0AAV7MSA6_PLEWA|nr:hypothetical protein NDU88_002742 [Pleurodeles waltl]
MCRRRQKIRIEGFSLVIALRLSCNRLWVKVLKGISGVRCYQDDGLIYESSVEEHDDRVHAVLRRLLETGLKLRKDKSKFGM